MTINFYSDSFVTRQDIMDSTAAFGTSKGVRGREALTSLNSNNELYSELHGKIEALKTLLAGFKDPKKETLKTDYSEHVEIMIEIQSKLREGKGIDGSSFAGSADDRFLSAMIGKFRVTGEADLVESGIEFLAEDVNKLRSMIEFSFNKVIPPSMLPDQVQQRAMDVRSRTQYDSQSNTQTIQGLKY